MFAVYQIVISLNCILFKTWDKLGRKKFGSYIC